MIKTKALSSAAILGMVAMLFAGCGDGDNTKTEICRPSVSTCLENANAGRVCNSDGTELVDFTCGSGETCEDGQCVAECEDGAQSCSGPAINRVCSDGNSWLPVVCPAGTACEDGAGCVPSEEGTNICDPDAAPTCANDTTVKTCDADGDGFTYTQCGDNQRCDDGECVFDEGSVCTPRETQCLDAETSVKCNDDGDGWEVTDCPSTAPCTNGVCQGPVCVVGDTKCDEPALNDILNGAVGNGGAVDFGVLYRCVDGTNWVAELCDAGMICAYDNITKAETDQWVDNLVAWFEGSGVLSEFPSIDTSDSVASCVQPECDRPLDYYGLLWNFNGSAIPYFGLPLPPLGADIYQCGDATDPSASLTDSYSVCTGLPPFQNLTWSNVECPAPTECTIKITAGLYGFFYAPTCASDCTPGEISCGAIDGTRECDDDGKWGPLEECPLIEFDGEDAYQGYCVSSIPGGLLPDNIDPGLQPITGACVDPVCAYWEFYGDLIKAELELDPNTPLGACTPDGLFRACGQDGMLGDPEECGGLCDPLGGPLSNAAGQVAGICSPPECEEGETLCFSDGASGLFHTCVDGHWSVELEQCEDDALCLNYLESDGSLATVCGECVPGTLECDENTPAQIRECGDDATWGDFEECSYGQCLNVGGFVRCEAECLEGQMACPNTTQVQTCVDGLLSTAEDCDVGTFCRTDSDGVVQGCVQCLGPNTGGNSYGVVDAYCTDESEIVTCGGNNTWGSPASACSGTCNSPGGLLADPPSGTNTYAYCGP